MARSTQLPAAAWAKLKKVRSWSEYTREGQLLLHTVYQDPATKLRVKRTQNFEVA